MTAKTSTASLAQLPVSRKFYNALLVRVDGILSTIFANPSPEYSRLARRMIDSYLRDDLASIPENAIVSEVRIIFLTLKAEIDRAVERSARARARRNTCKRPNRCKPDHNIPAIPPATSSVSSATTPETDLAKSDTIQTIPPVIPTDTQEDTST
ncbi:MAG: hypothetical protein K2K72_00750, partial [Duncaniella sp.]|nr:hypothetical protein [Duncaniella sp.]